MMKIESINGIYSSFGAGDVIRPSTSSLLIGLNDKRIDARPDAPNCGTNAGIISASS